MRGRGLGRAPRLSPSASPRHATPSHATPRRFDSTRPNSRLRFQRHVRGGWDKDESDGLDAGIVGDERRVVPDWILVRMNLGDRRWGWRETCCGARRKAWLSGDSVDVERAGWDSIPPSHEALMYIIDS